MAQTKRKRTRKHRGTPAGTIERAGRTGRPQTREDAKQIARQRRQLRFDTPPNWRSAINRAAIAAAVFGVLVIMAFGRSIAQGVILAGFMFLLYIPLGYMTDQAVYRYRRRRKRPAHRPRVKAASRGRAHVHRRTGAGEHLHRPA